MKLGLALGIRSSVKVWFWAWRFFSHYSELCLACSNTVMCKQVGTPKLHVFQFSLYRFRNSNTDPNPN